MGWKNATRETPRDVGLEESGWKGTPPPRGEPVPSCASIGMWEEADFELPLLFLLLWLLIEWCDCSFR